VNDREQARLIIDRDWLYRDAYGKHFARFAPDIEFIVAQEALGFESPAHLLGRDIPRIRLSGGTCGRYRAISPTPQTHKTTPSH
jgi:hypothetical protein